MRLPSPLPISLSLFVAGALRFRTRRTRKILEKIGGLSIKGAFFYYKRAIINLELYKSAA